jgi:hypothetical protein
MVLIVKSSAARVLWLEREVDAKRPRGAAVSTGGKTAKLFAVSSDHEMSNRCAPT